jgi:uncharacterized FlaG/YvyC family protein
MLSLSLISVTSTPVAAELASGRGGVPALPAASSPATQKTAALRTDDVTGSSSPERVNQAVKQVNDAFVQKGQDLYAAIERDKTSGISVVIVFDRTTKEQISQFPTKAIIAIAEAISQSNEGKVQLMRVSA